MKRQALTLTLIMLLSFFIADGLQLVNLTKANPYAIKYVREGEGSPPEGTLPPTISILSPKNNTAYAANNVSLTFDVSLPKSNNHSLSLAEVYYKTSWQSSNTYVGERAIADLKPLYSHTFSINLTDVPDGPRWLEVYAVGQGRQVTHEVCDSIFSTIYYLSYEMTGSSIVNFTIDPHPPKVSIPSLENKTYSTSTIPLNFMTNERILQSTYSLDGKENVTIAGNTTLTGLSNGDHNVTVYATDEAGNIGVSEIIYFSVEEPFPTAIVITASGASAAIIVISLLVYLKKRKRGMKHE